MVTPSNDSFSCREMEQSFRQQFQKSNLRFLSGNDILSHAVCGLTEEAGEVAGLLKREVYRGTAVSKDRWLEEIGDTLWYVLAVADAKGITLDEIFEYNQKKCAERYGEF